MQGQVRDLPDFFNPIFVRAIHELPLRDIPYILSFFVGFIRDAPGLL